MKHLARAWIAYLSTYGLRWLALAALFVIALQSAAFAWTAANHWWLERTPVSEWVQYHSVEFQRVQTNPPGLVMESDVTWHVAAEVSYTDDLRCIDPETEQEVLLKRVSWPPAARDQLGRSSNLWTLGVTPPIGGTCRVTSVVTIERDGVVKLLPVTSPPFIVS